MTCKEIIQDYLKTHGYDGLYNEMGECGCDGDAPCESGELPDCEPAYLHECKTCEIKARGDPCTVQDGEGEDTCCYSIREKPLCKCNSPLVPAFITITTDGERKPMLEPGTGKQFMKCPKCDQVYPPLSDEKLAQLRGEVEG